MEQVLPGGRKTRVCMTIDKDLVELLRQLSREDGRSLSQYVNFRLRKAVDREWNREMDEMTGF